MRKMECRGIFLFFILTLTTTITFSQIANDHYFIRAYSQPESPTESPAESPAEQPSTETLVEDNTIQNGDDVSSQEVRSIANPALECKENELLVDNLCIEQGTDETEEESSSVSNGSATESLEGENNPERVSRNNINNNQTTPNNQPEGPDQDCLFDPSLPKCAVGSNENCPEGFAMNENSQCVPIVDSCPDGFHKIDDDETGTCYPNEQGCPDGMIFTPDKKNCGYTEFVCENYPELSQCTEEISPAANSSSSSSNNTSSDTLENNTTISKNPPIAIASIDKRSVCEGERVTLDGSRSYDPDPNDEIVSHYWNVEEWDDEDNSASIISPNSIRTAVDTKDTLNSNSGGMGIEYNVVDSNGSTAWDFVTFTIINCPDGSDDDDDEPDRAIIQADNDCNIISETVNLGGQIEPFGIRIIGFFDQCQVEQGSLLLNLPNDNNIRLVVGAFDFDSPQPVQLESDDDAIYLDLIKMQQVSSHLLSKVSFEDPVQGKDLLTNQPKELSNINTIVLWNDSGDPIAFDDSNTVSLSIDFENQ